MLTVEYLENLTILDENSSQNVSIIFLQDTPAKDLMQYLKKCADDSGINGVIDCGSRRLIRSINKASLMDDIEIIPGLHIVR